MNAKIIQINKGAALLRADFVDILNTWLDLYVYMDAPGVSNKTIRSGLLKVAASFYIIDELKNSPAAYRINKAKILAQNSHSIEEIKSLISDAVLILTH